MITVKEAAAKAAGYLRDLLGSDITAIQLEEVELVDDDRFWLITLGFSEDADVLLPAFSRKYKTFKIDAESGRIVAMKIRELH